MIVVQGAVFNFLFNVIGSAIPGATGTTTTGETGGAIHVALTPRSVLLFWRRFHI